MVRGRTPWGVAERIHGVSKVCALGEGFGREGGMVGGIYHLFPTGTDI